MPPRYCSALLISACLAFSACAASAARVGLSRTGSIVRDDPSKEEEAALSFLYRNMPDTDRKNLKYDFLRLNTRQALAARADNDWALDVPWDIFLNYVLVSL